MAQPFVSPDAVPVKKRSKRRSRCLLPVVCVCIVIVGFNTAISLLLIQWHQPATVAFDMKGTIDRFMEQTAQLQLQEQQSADVSRRFTKALEHSLADYQRRHGAVILVAPSVVSGAEDITATIQQEVALLMVRENTLGKRD